MAGPEMLTILIVDPEPMVNRTLSRLMEAGGHRALVAETGVRAVALFQSNPDIQAVLVDDSLPDIGALPLAQLLQAQRSVPVVVMSGFYAPPKVEQGSTISVLKKPFRMLDLVDRLVDLTAQRSTYRRDSAWSM